MPLNKIVKTELIKIAVNPDGYPDESLPEIAFAGRSNVGKSSLLNSVMNRKDLARTSSKPGKTRTINFYEINNEIRLVDLPGYGYAIASRKEMDNWKKYIETYFRERNNLVAIVQVVDIRHKPSKDDIIMNDFIKASGLKSMVVATKGDKIAKGRYQQAIKEIRTSLNTKDEILVFSSLNKYGVESVRYKLWEVAYGED